MITPEKDELPSSFAARVARDLTMSLHQFTRYVLGLSPQDNQTDLDLVLVSRSAEKLAAVAEVPIRFVHAMALPARLRLPSWDGELRRHCAQIYICPECLRDGNRVARRIWRSRIGFVCLAHGRFLTGTCQNCGGILRHRMPSACGGSFHWLDIWPYCPTCGDQIEPGAEAPKYMLQMGKKWAEAFAQQRLHSVDDPLLTLSIRIVSNLAANVQTTKTCARKLELHAGVNDTAAVASSVVNALFKGDALRENSANGSGRALFNFVAGIPYDPDDLACALVGHTG